MQKRRVDRSVMGGRAAGLGGFLRTRRARLHPADVGTASMGRRRVPGLRREELAQLAGVSTDYLTRLEQGRDLHPSVSVLNSLAAALRLDTAERDYLQFLAGAHRDDTSTCSRQLPAQQPSNGGLHLLAALTSAPALILGRRMQVLAQNPPGAGLLGDLTGKNLLRALFLDPDVRVRHADWEQAAAQSISFLRTHALRDGADRDLCRLVTELSGDATFARLWDEHHVHNSASGTTHFAHPDAGHLILDYQILPLPDPEQWLLVYTTSPHSTDHLALELQSNDPALVLTRATPTR
ncbi:helix-turn-helix transcriptional regulator [Rhodococcoides yunnanense]|uniref:helix-turn-helix transcriptional regulator n=1 Tax=Rhodococcoides yunnanense TaxID=278209 RepID=UPI0009FD89E0|nr:helix-turn-helix transcriptional regulator [Rhodococcus yunnanensis]